MVTYKKLDRVMTEGVRALLVLSGDTMGPSGQSHQDMAIMAANQFSTLSAPLKDAARGDTEPFMSFPSPSEIVEKLNNER